MPQNNNTKRYRNWPPQDPPMFWATFAAFVAVCVYAAFTYLQVQETREANGIAQQALFFANRPYVMWESYVTNLSSELPGRQEWRISAVVRNFGKTQAVDVIGKICDPQIRGNTSQPSFRDCPISEKVDQITIIGPEQDIAITGPAITTQDFDDITKGHKLLYIYGDIRYSDNVTHHIWATRFCHQVQIQLV